MELKNNQRNVFWQTKEAAIKALVELDDQGGKNQLFIAKNILMYSEKFRDNLYNNICAQNSVPV